MRPNAGILNFKFQIPNIVGGAHPRWWRGFLPLLLSAGGLFGCAQDLPQRQYYILQAQRSSGEGGAGPAAPAVLLVEPFRVDAAFAGRQLVYRVSEFGYETDYYHQFLTPPATMLSERTRDWFANSGLFQQVVAPGGPAPATHTLTGHVVALYGDFAHPTAATAVLEIRFSLLRAGGAGETTLFSKTYQARNSVTARAADAVVAALNQDLVQILTQLETDVRQHLGSQAGSGVRGQGATG